MKIIALLCSALVCAAPLFSQNAETTVPLPNYSVHILFDEHGQPIVNDSPPTNQANPSMDISVQMPASPSIQNQTYQQRSADVPQPAPVPAPQQTAAPPPAQTSVSEGRKFVTYPAPTDGGKTYRLQVGAFKALENAYGVYDSLIVIGMVPALEPHEDTYRVVVPFVPADRVNDYITILQSAGFSVWMRNE
jgi:cell division protein FtsN